MKCIETGRNQDQNAVGRDIHAKYEVDRVTPANEIVR
jgi:hypothetical protein